MYYFFFYFVIVQDLVLFYNFNFLLWHGRESKIAVEAFEIFPWVLWYIRKSRNRFLFENVGEPPNETLDFAIREASAWKLANSKEESTDIFFVPLLNVPLPSILTTECQIDASWHEDYTLGGHGWVLVDRDKILYLGLKNARRCLSPLHAEVNSLLWLWSA